MYSLYCILFSRCPVGSINFTYYNLVVQDQFNLDSETGVITIARPLRAWKMYMLHVNAIDHGDPVEFSE